MKKIMAFMLSVIMLLGSLTIDPFVNIALGNDDLSNITIQSKDMTMAGYFIYGSAETQPLRTKIDYYKDSSGSEQIVYCIDPLLKGVSEVGSYTVSANQPLNDPVISRIIENGYPTKSPSEMGVSSEFEAYYVTKMAIYMHVRYGIMTSWRPVSPEFSGLLDKTKQLYESSSTATYSVLNRSAVVATPDTIQAILDGEFYVQTFSVSGVNGSFSISLGSDAPTGTKITDINGTAKNTFAVGEKFKIAIPTQSVDTDGNFSFTINGGSDSSTLMRGTPTNSNYQDYAVPVNAPATGTGVVTYVVDIDDTEQPVAKGGQIQILKYEEGTLKPLSGSIFRVTDALNGVLGHYTTDTSGQVTINTGTGAFYIEEITPPSGYSLSRNSHADVIVTEDEPCIVSFGNEKSPIIEVYKQDENTGKGLKNAVITIALDGGHESFDVITDSTGKAVLTEGLRAGATYKIVEKTAPENYIYDPSPVYIKTVAGEISSAVLTNKHEGGLLIKKYDINTGLPLPLAEFSVTVKGTGTVIYEGMTDEKGEIFIENINADNQWLTITEIAPPPGYQIIEKSRDIFFKAGEDVVEVKFDNIELGKLMIIKVNQSSDPLSNATIKVIKLEDKTVSTYITDETGTILIENLEEGIYQISEESAPEGYIGMDGHIDISVELGKCKTVVVENVIKPKIKLIKVDSVHGTGIPETTYRLTYIENGKHSDYTTNEHGEIVMDNLDEGIVKIEELFANDEYIKNPDIIEVELKAGDSKEFRLENTKKPTLVITKRNALTNSGVPNTTYKIQYENPNGGIETVGTYRTNSEGKIILPKMRVGWYIITETIPAQGMQLPSNPVTRVYLSAGDNTYDLENGSENNGSNDNDNQEQGAGGNNGSNSNDEIKVYSGHDFEVDGEGIVNYPTNSIVLKKNDAITSEMLEGAVFELYKVTEDISGSSGTLIGRYTTDSSGIVVITGCTGGGYIAKEVKAPTNYLISENSQQQLWLKYDGTSIAEVTFSNYPYGSILIFKQDDTGNAVPNVKMKVTDSSGAVVGSDNGVFVTDSHGQILITGLKPDSYVVTEIDAGKFHQLDSTPQTIKIGTDGKTYKLTFTNKRLATFTLKKVSSVDKSPIEGVLFRLSTVSGTTVGNSLGEFKTDSNGLFYVNNLSDDTYILQELKNDGYIVTREPIFFEIKNGEPVYKEIENTPLATLTVKKISSKDRSPIGNVVFRLSTIDGTVVGNSLGEYKTGSDGLFYVENLSDGTYVLQELKNDGYIVTREPIIFEIKDGEPVYKEIENTPLATLTVKKISSKDRSPIGGAVFRLSTINGTIIGSSLGEFKTGSDGLIHVENLSDGTYVLQELKNDGYIVDREPILFEIKDGSPVFKEVENTPYATLLLEKTSSKDNKPIQNTEFLIERLNETGRYEEVGYFTTDKYGRIELTDLKEGKFRVKETKSAKGFEKTEEVFEVTVGAGEYKKLSIQNDPLSSIIVHKIDSITQQGIYGATFILYDSDNNPMGQFTSDNEGYIWINKELAEGKYKLREIEPAKGYYPDNVPRTVYVQMGKTTEIEWENTPMAGQLQVFKTSEDNNEMNGLPAKTPIQGCIFEVYDYKSGNIVDKFVTGYDGKGVSKPLPLGRYLLKEVQTAPYYKINNQEIDVTIEFATQIVKIDVTNESANIGVSINKTAPREVVAGQEIRYDIKDIRNTSTVPINDFYWRDTLPTDAIRIDKIVTGTYSQSLKYKILVTTNKGGTRVIADNLATTQNNVVDCSGVALGLGNDEYITSFQLMFGTVKAGFASVDEPRIYGIVNKGLPNGYRFANKVDIGGQYNGEWIITNATAGTEIYSYHNATLPKTGY